MTDEDRLNWGHYIPFDLFEDDAIEYFARRKSDADEIRVKIWYHQSDDPELKSILPSKTGKNYGHDFGGIFTHKNGEEGLRGNAFSGAYGKYLYEVQHSGALLALDDVASLVYSSERTDEVIKREFGEDLDASEFDAIKDEISGSVKAADLTALGYSDWMDNAHYAQKLRGEIAKAEGFGVIEEGDGFLVLSGPDVKVRLSRVQQSGSLDENIPDRKPYVPGGGSMPFRV